MKERDFARTLALASVMRRALRWLFPGGLVAAVALALAAGVSDARLAVAVDRYELAVFGIGLTLSGVFHRSRVFIGLLGPTLYGVFGAQAPASADLVPIGSAYLSLLGMLAVGRDRGVASRSGLMQLAVAAAFTGLIWMIVHDVTAVPVVADPGAAERAGLRGAALVVASLAVVAGLFGVYRWRGSVERGLLWSQGLTLLALHPSTQAAADSVFLTAIGVTLALSVIETTYAMAFRDELTGLPARRSLARDLDDADGGPTYALAMVDVDHFKKFNDRHGHDVGDQVLKLVAGCLAKAPGGGKAYRYGGEEFAVLYRGQTTDDALPHLEALRLDVEASRFALRSWTRPRTKPKDSGRIAKDASDDWKRGRRSLSVTVSIGVADSGRGEAAPDEVLKDADQALYRAKEAGRNRVMT